MEQRSAGLGGGVGDGLECQMRRKDGPVMWWQFARRPHQWVLSN